MHLEPTHDQRALAAGLRDLLQHRFPLAHVQALADGAAFDPDTASAPAGGGTFDPEGWAALAEAGVFSLRVPEGAGGVGLGMAEAVLVFEELGRALVPGPLVATHLAHLAAPHAGWGAVAWLDAVARPLLLAHPDAVGTVLVAGGDALRAVHRADVGVSPVARPLDPLTLLAEVTSLPAGEPVTADVGRLRHEGAVLTAALLVGIAGAVTEQATAYARQRQQFGRPIGAFQAVKHLCADMLVRTEVARAALHSAAVHLDDPQVGEVPRAVRSAKLLAGEAAVANAKAAIQVHGGTGFTWEAPLHLYLKRALVLEHDFGPAREHAAALGAALQ